MTIKQVFLVIVFLPLLWLQFANLISWIAAEPIANLETSGLEFDAVPEGSRTYIVNHGRAMFSSHGTISENPMEFLFWIFVFLLYLKVFGMVSSYFEHKNT